MGTDKLSSYFKGIAWKRLSVVEVDQKRSHQHEFHGAVCLQKLFGKKKKGLNAQFVYLGDTEDDTVRNIAGRLTWYDARKRNSSGADRIEYRLYFSDNAVSSAAKAGDLFVLGKRSDTAVVVVIAKAGSTYEKQIQWLFSIDDSSGSKFNAREIVGDSNVDLNYVNRIILDEIGIETAARVDDVLGILLKRFQGVFPATALFSEFARETSGLSGAIDDPDRALLVWMDHEEKLFKSLEYHIVSKDLEKGVASDVDGFLRYSLQVQNRRKSRSGRALEHHLEYIFKESKIRYSRTERTENNSKPDFIFPGINEYRDASFPVNSLSMLGVKTTCKDRWRQVLAEANRIKNKHLLTLEPAISQNQTDEMMANNLQLVLPAGLFSSYSLQQQKTLISLNQFIALVKNKQL